MVPRRCRTHLTPETAPSMIHRSSLGTFTSQLKTWTLLAALGGLLVARRWASSVAGPAWSWRSASRSLLNVGVYWFSDRLALKANGARPLQPGEAPQFERIVRDLTGRAGIPMPSLYIIDRPEPNAFATGRNAEPRGGRGDHGHPRHHGRAPAARRPGPRDQPHHQPGHARRHHRGDHRRRPSRSSATWRCGPRCSAVATTRDGVPDAPDAPLGDPGAHRGDHHPAVGVARRGSTARTSPALS